MRVGRPHHLTKADNQIVELIEADFIGGGS